MYKSNKPKSNVTYFMVIIRVTTGFFWGANDGPGVRTSSRSPYGTWHRSDLFWSPAAQFDPPLSKLLQTSENFQERGLIFIT